MNLNEIEPALANDHSIEPSSDLSARVMAAVRQQAQARDALTFPWSRLVGGLATCAAVVFAGLVFGPTPSLPEGLVSALEDPTVVQALTWIPTSLVGTWALVWMSLRFAGLPR